VPADAREEAFRRAGKPAAGAQPLSPRTLGIDRELHRKRPQANFEPKIRAKFEPNPSQITLLAFQRCLCRRHNLNYSSCAVRANSEPVLDRFSADFASTVCSQTL
jgi:hypothetical protein